jgi:isocitrate lyase
MGRQREAGTGYFDQVAHAIAPDTETAALPGATESAQ